MSCILEDEGLEIPSIASTLNQEQLAQQIAAMQQQQHQLQLQAQQQQQQQQQIFNCDLCNYSSSYKGNVVSLRDKNIYSVKYYHQIQISLKVQFFNDIS